MFRPSFKLIFRVTISLVLGGAGLIWLVNLPYPMIRRPVSRVAPILLLPSYLSMDRNYRDAIANVEQSNQLIIKATSVNDIELGEEKVNAAKQNLEALPVWFLGYEPKRYCSLMGGCSWKFTFDEFEAARKQIGRMEAIVFQEKNALIQLNNSQNVLEEAENNYKNATNLDERQTALEQWRKVLQELSEIPPQTWAGKSVQSKLKFSKQEFEKLAGSTIGFQQTSNVILAAKEFGKNAAKMTQNPPHSVTIWEQSQNLWNQAIKRLETVSINDSGYVESQKLLATYRTNLAQIEIRKQAEANSLKYLQQAENQINQLLANSNADNNYRMSQLQDIINKLEQVESGTTSYKKSQELLQSARNKLKEFEKVQ